MIHHNATYIELAGLCSKHCQSQSIRNLISILSQNHKLQL